MKIVAAIALLCTLYAVYIMLPASSTTSLRIAVLDMGQVVENVPQIQEHKRELESTLHRYHEDFSDREKELKKESDSINKLAYEAKTPQETDFLNIRRQSFENSLSRLQKKVEEKQKDIENHHLAFNAMVKNAIDLAIQNIRKRHEIDIIIHKRDTIYVQSTLDITPEVTTMVKESLRAR